MRVSVAVEPWEVDGNTPKFVGSVPEASKQLRELAEPRRAGEPVKVAIDRAAGLSGLPYWRAFDVWYRKARRIEQFEHDALAAALVKKRKFDARKEFQELRTRMARLEAMLAQTDEEFHRDTIEQVRGQFRR